MPVRGAKQSKQSKLVIRISYPQVEGTKWLRKGCGTSLIVLRALFTCLEAQRILQTHCRSIRTSVLVLSLDPITSKMSIAPIITFKAGVCDLDVCRSTQGYHNITNNILQESTSKAQPQPTPGYVYLYSEEDLMHFCWRPRSATLEDPELDLIMFPGDGTFTPYQKSRVSGRVFVLKFSSSSQRHLFWLQSKSQSTSDDPSFFSARDLKLGEVVNSLLQGEEVDVQEAVAEMRAGHPPGDEDETMEDVEGTDHDREGGGAGAGATGGDIREEGEGAREGGADGGRA